VTSRWSPHAEWPRRPSDLQGSAESDIGSHNMQESVQAECADRDRWKQYAFNGFFAISKWFAACYEEHGVFLHRSLDGFLTTQSERVGADQREEDDRCPGRDDDDAETINLTYFTNTTACL